MGAANGTQFRLVNAEVELRRETRDLAQWTLADVEHLHRRFQKTPSFAVTASQLDNLLQCRASERIEADEVFEALDINHDGRVDGLELLAALACVCRAKFEDKAKFAFDLFDFNHNGSLSVAELALLMKSVLIGMALLTGVATNAEDAMSLCLGLAENAFFHVDDGSSMLGFDEFIAWARRNREFMLQVERFRLIADKAVGVEDALSLPEGSDNDSDLDVEELRASAQRQDIDESKRVGLGIPQPWMVEPRSPSLLNSRASVWAASGMPPPMNLRLEWVYGSYGPFARNVCRYVATGEAVYFVGSYTVLYLSERHKQRHYCGHQRAIGCLAVNATGELVATGDACSQGTTGIAGEAEVHVWNAKTLQCLAVLRTFDPVGVAHVCFTAAASAANATLQQPLTVSMGERNTAGGTSAAVLHSHLSKEKPHETEALLASIGGENHASLALWNWQTETVVASGRVRLRAGGQAGRVRPLALALNEDGDELVVVGAHFVMFYHVHGHVFKPKQPHWHGAVKSGVQTIPVCLSVVYSGLQTAVVGTGRGELMLFDRHTLTRCVQAHERQTSVNVCLLSCQSMVLFTAGKDGQIKQWDSTLHSIGQALNLNTRLPALSSSANVLEGDDLRICSLDYDAQRTRFLVSTRMGNIFELDDKELASSAAPTIVASGHTGQPTQSIATARTGGGTFASCGVDECFVKIWSLRRRAFVQYLRLPGASATPSALAFSSDGERLAVGSEDGMVLLARQTGRAPSMLMTTEAVMKNTSTAVRTMRFGPLETDPLLAVARANGLIYLYRLEAGRRRFSRYLLLPAQAQEHSDMQEDTHAHALDFSNDGGFLRAQHGSSTLSFWDLRQRAGTRVTSMSLLRTIQWQTHSVSIGWDVGGLASLSGDSVVANRTQGLALVFSSKGDIKLAPFPCQPSTTTSMLASRVGNAHLTRHALRTDLSCRRSVVFGDFGLRGNVVITGSQVDAAICQWRVDKELSDVQPRPACRYDQLLCHRLQVFGVKETYFPLDTRDETRHHVLPRRPVRDISHAVAIQRGCSSFIQRSEAPGVALTLSFVYGFNHHNMSVNQSLACLENGLFVYGAGSLLVVRPVHALSTNQRLVTTGLHHSVSCIVKHPTEPILAVASRRDDQVVLLQTEKTSIGRAYQQVTTLDSHFLSLKERHILIAVDFCVTNDNGYGGVQGDLVAAIWKSSVSHVHTLVFYAWKRKLVLAHTAMTRLPVLFGRFAGTLDTIVAFVSGGIDHVTFWSLDPATKHVIMQQGVFGRHAAVQTITCATSVAPFVVTGGEDGAVIVWENCVAAHTVRLPNTFDGIAVVALEHLSASHVVVGALRNGSLAVWRYTKAFRATRQADAIKSRIQASTFLHLTHVISVDHGKTSDSHVRGMHLLDEGAVACLVLSTGEVTSVELQSILDDAGPTTPTFGGPREVRDSAKGMLNVSSKINDIALHPCDFCWASASADGHVSVWHLPTNTLSQQTFMPSSPRALAWSSTGAHLAVSLSDGQVAILNGTTLERVHEFTCGGHTETAAAFPLWCNIVKYSLLFNPNNGSAVSRSWLALAGRDYVIYVYACESSATSLPSFTLHDTLVGHTAPIEALDYSLDCHFLQSATSSTDRQLMRWSLQKAPVLLEGNVSEPAREWTLFDDAWASWTATFAGPVAGLANRCSVGTVTSLARINSDSVNGTEKWSSRLPTMLVGLDNGQLMLAWYPLTRTNVMAPADSNRSNGHDPAFVAKTYWRCFPRDASIHRIAFSVANAYVVALTRHASGSTQVAVWKSDYDDEMQYCQKFALKATRSRATWYHGPVDRSLFDQCIRAQPTKVAMTNDRLTRIEGHGTRLETPQSLAGCMDEQEAHLEFVYGLNASATGSGNVFYANDTDEIIYTAGAYGVVYNTKTRTQDLNYKLRPDRQSIISALAVHPRRDLVASGECLVGSCDGARAPEIVIWDANSGSTVVRIASAYLQGILLLQFSLKGHRLASIGMLGDHPLAIYALSSGAGRLCATLLVTCPTSSRRVWGLSFGENGSLATCGDQHILFWHNKPSKAGEDTTGLKTGLFTSHKACDPHATLLQIVHVANRVVSSQSNGSLYVWKDRVCVRVRHQAHGDTAIPALAVDRQHARVYSAGHDGRICVWTTLLDRIAVVADLAQLATARTSLSIQSLCVRDGHVLFATAQCDVCELLSVHQTTQGSSEWRLVVHIRGHGHGQVSCLAAHPCKRAHFASAGNNGTVHMWDAATRSIVACYHWARAPASLERTHELQALTFSSDGKYVAVGTRDGVVRVLTAALDRVVTQWNCWQDQPQRHAVSTLQYSNDGTLLAVACRDGTIYVYDVPNYDRITLLRAAVPAPNANAIQLDFARDRPILRVQWNGQQIQCWQLGSWKTLSVEQVHDAHWKSTQYPFLGHGTTSNDVDSTALYGQATPGLHWVITKSKRYLLSTAGSGRVVYQYRLPQYSTSKME